MSLGPKDSYGQPAATKTEEASSALAQMGKRMTKMFYVSYTANVSSDPEEPFYFPLTNFIVFATDARVAELQAKAKRGAVIASAIESGTLDNLDPDDLGRITFTIMELDAFIASLIARGSELSHWKPVNGEDFCEDCGHLIEDADIAGGRCTFCKTMLVSKPQE